jgi:ketosteroid isomerase-like protein
VRLARRVSDRGERIRRAYDALDRGDAAEFDELFAKDAQWLGAPGSAMDGETPI